MDMDEDDDLYQPEEPKVEPEEEKKHKAEELEEGEEEDESGAMDEDDDEDDSVRYTVSDASRSSHADREIQDIDIITERKDGTKAAPPPYVQPGHI